jgi:hypothetical protein
MNYEFNNEYLAKLFLSLIREEGNRIMSLGLAKNEDLTKLVDSSITLAIKNIKKDNPDSLLNVLSILHDKLSSVKLPGDFIKVACDMQDKLIVIFEIPEEEHILDVSVPAEEKGVKKVVEKEYEDKDGKKIVEKTEGIVDDKDDEEIKKVVAELEEISYKLGKQGKHNAAYEIDRTIRDLELSIKKE